ncbi:MAG: hypothetical protein JHC52_06325 [Chthoniobacterales bacterium]|jgi:hypothetical protein|nr:hypothetical protein [Chthoniobacterales bacterium]
MNATEFHALLDQHAAARIVFVLPDGGMIPPHAHVTEVGRVDRRFLDCGATLRQTSFCCLQTWVADDTHHRLTAGKLAGILGRATQPLDLAELPLEVEYEDGFISQFPVISGRAHEDALVFELGLKHTDCLAKELCLPPAKDDGACCGDSGCC